jgi:molybdopterin synthase catalytic subunit
MRIKILYFAFLKDRFGVDSEIIEVPDGCTVDQFCGLWEERYRDQGATRILKFVRLAVQNDYVDGDFILSPEAEVCFLPPVSGGAPEEGPAQSMGKIDDHVRLSADELEWGGAEALVQRAGAGAVATFRGVIRRESEGKEVVRLSYEAQSGMAYKMMVGLREAAIARPDITDVAIWHRLGPLEIGGLAVEISVSSPHRAASFEVCRSIIEAFKTDIPVFKHEVFADGTSAWKHRCH